MNKKVDNYNTTLNCTSHENENLKKGEEMLDEVWIFSREI